MTPTTMDLNQNQIKGTSRGYSAADHYLVAMFRGIFVATCFLGYIYLDNLQTLVGQSYSWLLETWVFNCVYFETFFATLCYAVAIVYPWLIDKCKWLDRYKVHPSVRYEHVTILFILKQAVFYMTPLMFLDTIMVKKYGGVEIDPEIWIEKRKSLIQTTRALPDFAPSVFTICWQLLASFILYDAIFFAFHLLLHKNYFLYKHVHRYHHDHETIHSHVTNQLTVSERITLVLTANFALKVFNSHPFTRTLFIPLFIGMLVENHTGYDMPFGYHRLVPFEIVGGSPKHFEHHMNGKRCYQPIFIYLDRMLVTFQGMRRPGIKRD